MANCRKKIGTLKSMSLSTRHDHKNKSPEPVSHDSDNFATSLGWLAAFMAIDFLDINQGFESFLRCRTEWLQELTKESTSGSIPEAIYSFLSTALLTNSLFSSNDGLVLSVIEEQVIQICPSPHINVDVAVGSQFHFKLPYCMKPQLDQIVKQIIKSCNLKEVVIDTDNVYKKLEHWIRENGDLLSENIPKMLEKQENMAELLQMTNEVDDVLTRCCNQPHVPSVAEVWNSFLASTIIKRFVDLMKKNFDEIKQELADSSIEQMDNAKLAVPWSAKMSKLITNRQDGQNSKNASDLFVIGHYTGQKNAIMIQNATGNLETFLVSCRDFVFTGLAPDFREVGFSKMRDSVFTFANDLIDMCKEMIEKEQQNSGDYNRLLILSSFTFSLNLVLSYLEDWLSIQHVNYSTKVTNFNVKAFTSFWADSRVKMSNVGIDAFKFVELILILGFFDFFQRFICFSVWL